MNARGIYLGVCSAVLVLAVGVWTTTATWTYAINLTHSLPGTLYVVHKGAHFAKGDLVAFRWHGGATYPPGTLFIKQAVGTPGDKVRRSGAALWVNDQYVGLAKTVSKAGVPLTPAEPGVIPQGEYFMATPSPDSLDSRYALSGNVKQSEVIGKAYAIF
jgi:conjugal transfer pilin signal peptidase TrbI